MTLNLSQFLRYEGTGKPSTNSIGNISFLRFPTKNSTTSLSVNTLETQYHKGIIYSGRISQNIFKGKAQLELNYRNVNYNFKTESPLLQNIIGGSFNMILHKTTSFILSYEGTFQKEVEYHRYYVTLTHRIKSKKK
jgi:hypothetical protein